MYNGSYLFKFGSYEFPETYIQWDSYKCKPNQRQDMDSYTDADGITQRNALEHTKTDIQFTTRGLRETDVAIIMSSLTSNYTNYNERDAQCEYYDPENMTYKTGHFYLDPSLEFSIQDVTGGVMRYKPISFHFVEY